MQHKMVTTNDLNNFIRSYYKKLDVTQPSKLKMNCLLYLIQLLSIFNFDEPLFNEEPNINNTLPYYDTLDSKIKFNNSSIMNLDIKKQFFIRDILFEYLMDDDATIRMKVQSGIISSITKEFPLFNYPKFRLPISYMKKWVITEKARLEILEQINENKQ